MGSRDRGEAIHQRVRQAHGQIAQTRTNCCHSGCGSCSCRRIGPWPFKIGPNYRPDASRGALVADADLGAIRAAGFVDVNWTRTSAASLLDGMLGRSGRQALIDAYGEAFCQRASQAVFSYNVRARKP